MEPVLQVWSAPRCQTGADAIAPLPLTQSADITETVAGTDDGGSFVVERTTAVQCGVLEGRVLRAVFPLRGVIEWVIVKVQRTDPGDLVKVTLGPLRQLLALRPFARTLTDLTVAHTFAAFSGTVAEYLNQRVLTNLTEDQLEWLSLGTMANSTVYQWPEQTMVRRGECLTTVEQVTGLECVLRRLTDDAGYALDVLDARGSSAEPVAFDTAALGLEIGETRNLLQAGTAVRPFGDDNLPMGEVDWIGGAVSGSGPYWIPLTDPTGGTAPIWEDDQFVGAYLGLPSGTGLLITDSRASDSAVQVASLGSYAAGQRVVFWENATGRPLSVVQSPTAIDSSRGLVEAKATIKGARQERTLNRNGGFEQGGTNWTHGDYGEPIARSDFGKTLNFLSNGSRASGTGTGTPFAVDGLPTDPPAMIYQFDQLIIDGVAHTFSADVVPNTSGEITASITPNLTATYADDTPVTVVRREVRQWIKDGTTSFADWASSGGLLAMRDVASDGLLFRPMTGLSLVHDASGLSFTGNVESIAYTSGFSGTFTVNTSGAIGTPPAQFTDGDTFTVIFTRETRTLRFNGTQSSGASSVSFKAVSALARRDWVNTDTLYAKRSLSATAVITAFDDTTNTATLNTGTSTIDGVDSADRDGIAALLIPQTHIAVDYTVSGGAGSPPANVQWIVQSISGSDMALTIDLAWLASAFGVAPFDITINSVTDQGGWPRTYTANWTVVDSYPVASGASWGSNGRATVSITVPAGRTIARGTPLYSNWVGGGASGAEAQSPTPLFAHAAVTGSASSLEVAGWDDYRSDWDGVSTLTTAVWRLFSGTAGSSFGFDGETLVCAVTTQADGTGAANVTLQAANTTTIANNSGVRIVRPAMIPAGERTTGSAMRLAVGNAGVPPTPTNLGVQSETAWLTVPSGQSRPVIGVARVALTEGSWSSGGLAPSVTLFNRTTNQTVLSRSIDGEPTITVETTGITVVDVWCAATITQSGLYEIRLHGGSATDLHRWCVVLDATFYVGSTPLPYFPGARSRVAFQRAQQLLATRSSASRYTLRGFDSAELQGTGTPLVPGQRARLRSEALGIDTTQRVVRLTWRFPDGELVQAECEALAPKLTDVTVSL